MKELEKGYPLLFRWLHHERKPGVGDIQTRLAVPLREHVKSQTVIHVDCLFVLGPGRHLVNKQPGKIEKRIASGVSDTSLAGDRRVASISTNDNMGLQLERLVIAAV